ncbi:MAG: inositol monophosphatase family protein [Patescibacteria group bacterium]|nr:inositol monophosphatase family protein [Patescibacteria group bacterium]
MLKHLEKMFEEVRNYLLEKGWQEREKYSKNPEKPGDISAKFDLEVEKIVMDYFQKKDLRAKIYTEESGEVKLVEKPEWTFFIDPVDGSVNFWRGIEGTAFAIAVAPGEVKIEQGFKLENIKYGLVGSVISGSICYAEKERGAYYKGIFSGFKEKKVFASKNKELENACVEIDLDFASVSPIEKISEEKSQKIERIFPLIYPVRRVKFIRRNGSAALGLMEIATGTIDAYIDARDRLTPENWLAPYLLIQEAGGIFTDFEGNKIREIRSFRETGSFLASGNQELHKKILDCLKVRR